MVNDWADDLATAGLGERLRGLRVQHGMSQARLAKPDLSDSYISLIEAGKRMPSTAIVHVLAERLGCSPSYLTCGVDESTVLALKTSLAEASRALHTGHVEQALAELTTLAANVDELPVIPALSAEVNCHFAAALEALGRFDEAIAVLRRLLEHVGGSAHLPIGSPGLDPIWREWGVSKPGDHQGLPTGHGPGPIGWAQWAAAHIALARCLRGSRNALGAAHAVRPAFTLAAAAADHRDAEAASAAVDLGAVLVEMLADTGQLLLASQACSRLLQIAEDWGHPHARLRAYQQSLLMAEINGDEQDTTRWARCTLDLLECNEEFRSASDLQAQCAHVLLRTRPEDAEGARDLLLRQLTRAGLNEAAPETLISLAEVELLLGCPDRAAHYSQQALQHIGRSHDEHRTHQAADTETGPDTSAVPKPGPATLGQMPDRATARALAALATAYTRLGNGDDAVAALIHRAQLLEQLGQCRSAALAWIQASALVGQPSPHEAEPGNEHAQRLQFYERALAAMGLPEAGPDRVTRHDAPGMVGGHQPSADRLRHRAVPVSANEHAGAIGGDLSEAPRDE